MQAIPYLAVQLFLSLFIRLDSCSDRAWRIRDHLPCFRVIDADHTSMRSCGLASAVTLSVQIAGLSVLLVDPEKVYGSLLMFPVQPSGKPGRSWSGLQPWSPCLIAQSPIVRRGEPSCLLNRHPSALAALLLAVSDPTLASIGGRQVERADLGELGPVKAAWSSFVIHSRPCSSCATSSAFAPAIVKAPAHRRRFQSLRPIIPCCHSSCYRRHLHPKHYTAAQPYYQPNLTHPRRHARSSENRFPVARWLPSPAPSAFTSPTHHTLLTPPSPHPFAHDRTGTHTISG